MGAVKFKVGNYAAYTGLSTKDNDTLYFITDAKKIFKGATDVTENIVVVTTDFPTFANAFEDKLYIKPSTLEVKTKISGQEAWTVLVPGYVTAGTDVLTANGAKIPTTQALIDYVTTTANSILTNFFAAKKTLAAYGITDAKIENGTITLGNATITPIPVVTGETGEVPKFKSDGTLESTGFTLGKSVPADAVFTDTTYSTATQSADGLMSSSDKTKLDGIETGANKTIVDSSLSATSENPVQNKVVKSALDNKLETSLKGAVNGLAELDSTGKVPSTQLPSYVDDVIEGYYYNSKFYKESTHTNEITGETGKIYVNLGEGTDQNKTYRWSGSAFVVISETLALGETSSTAYRGDRGKTAYDHSQVTSGNPHNVTKSEVGLGNVTNDKQVKAISSSTNGNVVTFGGTDGATVADSGKKIISSTPMGNANTDIPTANVVADAISTAIASKVDEISATAGDIITAGSDGAIADSGVTIAKYDSSTYATMGTSNTAVPTEKLVSDAITSKATNILGTGTADQVVTSTTTGVQRSGKTIGGSTLAGSPDADTLATEAAVSAGLSPKANKLTSSASTHVLVGSAGGDLADSGKTIGGSTLAGTPSADVLATEAAVSAAITSSISWESIS